jgi:hypothetical protein
MEIKKRRYRTKHEGKSKEEIAFFEVFGKYPTEREMIQWLPYYGIKFKQDEILSSM